MVLSLNLFFGGRVTVHTRRAEWGWGSTGEPHGFSFFSRSEKRVQVRLEVVEIQLCPQFVILLVKVLSSSKPKPKLLFS